MAETTSPPAGPAAKIRFYANWMRKKDLALTTVPWLDSLPPDCWRTIMAHLPPKSTFYVMTKYAWLAAFCEPVTTWAGVSEHNLENLRVFSSSICRRPYSRWSTLPTVRFSSLPFPLAFLALFAIRAGDQNGKWTQMITAKAAMTYLVELVAERVGTDAQLAVVVDHAPLLRKALVGIWSPTFIPKCNVFLAIKSRTRLETLVVQFPNSKDPAFRLETFVPPSVTRLTVRFDHPFPAKNLLKNLSTVVPRLESLTIKSVSTANFRRTSHSDLFSLPALSYKDAAELCKFQLLTELRLLRFSFDDFDSISNSGWRTRTAGIDEIVAWIQSNLPPIPWKNLTLGNFDNNYFWGLELPPADTDKAIKLGIVPDVKVLARLLGVWFLHGHNIEDRCKKLLKDFDLGSQLTYPLTDFNPFTLALTATHHTLPQVVFTEMFVPYIQRFIPKVMAANSLTMEQAALHISRRTLTVDHNPLYITRPDVRSHIREHLLTTHGYPLDVNLTHNGVPLFEALSLADAGLLVARATATNRTITLPDGFFARERSWEKRELAALANPEHFAQHSALYFVRLEKDTVMLDHHKSRVRLCQRIKTLANLSETTRAVYALAMLVDNPITLELTTAVSELVADENSRHLCLRHLHEQGEEGEHTYIPLLVGLKGAKPIVFADGTSFLNKLNCVNDAWDKVLPPNAIRLMSSAGTTPMHRWARTHTPQTFWRLCFRHKAQAEDFSIRNKKGQTPLAILATKLSRHLPHMESLLSTNLDDPSIVLLLAIHTKLNEKQAASGKKSTTPVRNSAGSTF